MPRFVYLVGLSIIAAAVAFVLTNEVLGPTPGPTEANMRRVKPGMTLREVESIMGGPGRSPLGWSNGRDWSATFTWVGAGGTVNVRIGGRGCFEGTGVVIDTWFNRTNAPNLIQRLRSMLGL